MHFADIKAQVGQDYRLAATSTPVPTASTSTSTPTIKALSLYQPWAWLVVNGYKKIENRKWHTRYRGSVLIHASKRFDWEEWPFIQRKCQELGIVLPDSGDGEYLPVETEEARDRSRDRGTTRSRNLAQPKSRIKALAQTTTTTATATGVVATAGEIAMNEFVYSTGGIVGSVFITDCVSLGQ